MTSAPNRTADELLAAWGRGWAASRSTAGPVALGDGAWRIEVGLPGHRRRDLLPAWPPGRLRDWAEGIAAPGRWIKALTDPAELQLPAAWHMHATEYLMSTPLSDRAAPALAPGYRAELARRGAVIECRVLAAEGQVAGRAQVGLAGRHAVFDQVVTEPGHRRLGLGRHAMALLAAAARTQGADQGLLVATEDGRALYAALGWRVDSPMAAASVAEPG
jgi:GNAT superfamily N-acetyltransferase